MATFASKTKSHDDKGRSRPGDCLLRREQDQLKQRLAELGVNLWSFYDAKRKYAPKEAGEKAYEEFYVPGEKIDLARFQALGVVEQTARHDMAEVDAFFQKLEAIFAKDDFTKAEVVDVIREFIPNFQHEERGKNLDQKM